MTAGRFKIGALWAVAVVLGWMAPSQPGYCRTGDSAVAEDTMLMFVGERLEVLTIASRREESAWQAPAIAEVITREDIRVSGDGTLAQALDRTPGFYMAQKEWGVLPYLRGIPNGALVLYDTVPMVSDTSKSLNQLGHGTSLASVKRIEIIRGPGSVLWGPDAFAGIVNIVPLTGRDIDGVETGVTYGEPGSARGGYLNAGGRSGPWDGFLSLSGRWEDSEDDDINLVRFWGDGKTAYPFEDRLGDGDAGQARYLEGSGRIGYGDWLSISGRISESVTPYGITRAEDDLTWRESRRTPLSFVKLETKWDLDRSSALRLMGSYTWLDPELEVIDRTLSQKERTTYAEAIYDRTLAAGSGQLTGGAAFREKRIEGAPYWSGSLPTFLGPDNSFNTLPIVTQADYGTRLWSVFGQYRHKLGAFDLWAGARFDEHKDYKSHLSYNLGVSWSPDDQWIVKLLHGTAYRTPYAQQLLQAEEPEPENIRSYNAQLLWKPSDRVEISTTGFFSEIDDHIVEDPYAGTEFSLPNTQRLYGFEIQGILKPIEDVEISANWTYLENEGPNERYHYNDYDYISEDGTLIPHFVEREYPYSAGPDHLFHLNGRWNPSQKISLFAGLSYGSEQRMTEIQGGGSRWLSETVDLNLSVLIRDWLIRSSEIRFSGRNLMGRDDSAPGRYTEIDEAPTSLEVQCSYKW